ncbi:IMPACT family protein [Limisalsivibrio acetivorans]|uniref:IMPACT family protein n=1 Tax=Limisalsivibrio acetivorans TaxID=1304888 RepID=UPI0003B6DFAA|nr:YigZ family protein [Limisalsivibrio acetivorans]
MKGLYTVSKASEACVEIKKSQFIAYLFPYASFNEAMENIRGKHPKGRHYVWAYRTINDNGQIEENSSDDGEPKNTSGKPTLKAMEGHSLIECAIITVRYFGGIKLGTGGLVRAYNDAAQSVIGSAQLISMDSLYTESITVPYDRIQPLEYLIEKEGLTILDRSFDALTATFKLQGEENRFAEVRELEI